MAPVQLLLALPPARMRDKNGQRRCGKRAGSGRKPTVPGRPQLPHVRRPDVNPRHPQHVTLRVVGDIGHLRKPHMYRAIRAALIAVIERDDFRIVHFSVQGNHLHVLCEADDRLALSRGIRAFQVSAAQRLNRAYSTARGVRRRGRVFADRYHVRPVGSVRQTRHVISYVLCNWRHHRGAPGPALFDGKLDPYSSAIWFPGWRERTTPTIHIPPGYEPPVVSRPRTWLLAESWKRARPISVYEVPGPTTATG